MFRPVEITHPLGAPLEAHRFSPHYKFKESRERTTVCFAHGRLGASTHKSSFNPYHSLVTWGLFMMPFYKEATETQSSQVEPVDTTFRPKDF